MKIYDPYTDSFIERDTGVKIDEPTKDYEPKLFRDLVLVVRCKDCKWYIDNTTVEESLKYCRWRTDESPDEDDFCSLGERREK